MTLRLWLVLVHIWEYCKLVKKSSVALGFPNQHKGKSKNKEKKKQIPRGPNSQENVLFILDAMKIKSEI